MCKAWLIDLGADVAPWHPSYVGAGFIAMPTDPRSAEILATCLCYTALYSYAIIVELVNILHYAYHIIDIRLMFYQLHAGVTCI